jgi:hypothetical protein
MLSRSSRERGLARPAEPGRRQRYSSIMTTATIFRMRVLSSLRPRRRTASGWVEDLALCRALNIIFWFYWQRNSSLAVAARITTPIPSRGIWDGNCLIDFTLPSELKPNNI